jgi:predicted DNA-binding antitoxin AbrB/MazE fold protein
MTVKAIYEKGVFRPTEPVNLPEKAEVELMLPDEEAEFARQEDGRKAIMEILSRRFRSDKGNLAERHNEHQP